MSDYYKNFDGEIDFDTIKKKIEEGLLKAGRGENVNGIAIEGVNNDITSPEIQTEQQAQEAVSGNAEGTDYGEIAGAFAEGFGKSKKSAAPSQQNYNYGSSAQAPDLMKEMRLKALANLANKY